MEYQKDCIDSLIRVMAPCLVFRDPASIYQMFSGHSRLNRPADWGLFYLPSDCNGGLVEATLSIMG